MSISTSLTWNITDTMRDNSDGFVTEIRYSITGVSTETTGVFIKANHELDVAGTTETEAQGSDDDDTFRTNKTNLNTGCRQLVPIRKCNHLL